MPTAPLSTKKNLNGLLKSQYQTRKLFWFDIRIVNNFSPFFRLRLN